MGIREFWPVCLLLYEMPCTNFLQAIAATGEHVSLYYHCITNGFGHNHHSQGMLVLGIDIRYVCTLAIGQLLTPN